MVSLFRAEWQKTAGNRWAVGMLIWIFPAAAIGLSALAVLITLLSSDYREFMQQNYSSIPWNTRMIEMAGFLNNEIGRLIILAFTAIMFAGEYQYGTWKNLVPRRRRVALILTKFVTLAVFVTVSVIAFSIIATIGTGITAGIAGTDFGPAPTPEVIGQFLSDYLLQLGITLSATFIASGYAAVAAIITRNILGSLLVGFLFSMGETTVLLLTSLLYNVMKFPIEVMNVYLATPGYNLANISAWIKNDVGYAFRVTMDFSVGPFDIGVSILVIALWIVGAIALATFLFHRQDITV